MKERPILFSAPMVRATLREVDPKTQTRRIVKEPGWATPNTLHMFNSMPWADDPLRGDRDVPCPYGQPGDRLWVKETWANLTETHGQKWEKFNEETRRYDRGTHPFVWYRADGDQPNVGDGARNPERWRPSIYMPRWASRITLELTEVRVERLLDISEADARAEGIHQQSTTGWFSVAGINGAGTTARAAYALLWESLNGPGSWDANPLVWVLAFKRVTP